jgi:hypothetical protein
MDKCTAIIECKDRGPDDECKYPKACDFKIPEVMFGVKREQNI